MSSNIKIQEICEFLYSSINSKNLRHKILFAAAATTSKSRDEKRRALEKTEIIPENTLDVLRNVSQFHKSTSK